VSLRSHLKIRFFPSFKLGATSTVTILPVNDNFRSSSEKLLVLTKTMRTEILISPIQLCLPGFGRSERCGESFIALSGLYNTILLYPALHCTLPCTVLHCATPLYRALHSTVLYCSTLPCTELYCTTLHRCALHCPVLAYSARLDSCST
jgi:hypothetical protein